MLDRFRLQNKNTFSVEEPAQFISENISLFIKLLNNFNEVSIKRFDQTIQMLTKRIFLSTMTVCIRYLELNQKFNVLWLIIVKDKEKQVKKIR